MVSTVIWVGVQFDIDQLAKKFGKVAIVKLDELALVAVIVPVI